MTSLMPLCGPIMQVRTFKISVMLIFQKSKSKGAVFCSLIIAFKSRNHALILSLMQQHNKIRGLDQTLMEIADIAEISHLTKLSLQTYPDLFCCLGWKIATTQLNSTQSWVSLIFLWEPQPNHKPQNRIPLFLSSYTTKLDQIQYATLFQPN